jgi:hypothetical protein
VRRFRVSRRGKLSVEELRARCRATAEAFVKGLLERERYAPCRAVWQRLEVRRAVGERARHAAEPEPRRKALAEPPRTFGARELAIGLAFAVLAILLLVVTRS